MFCVCVLVSVRGCTRTHDDARAQEMDGVCTRVYARVLACLHRCLYARVCTRVMGGCVGTPVCARSSAHLFEGCFRVDRRCRVRKTTEVAGGGQGQAVCRG